MATINQQGKNNGNYKHGMCGTPEYRAWGGMIQRCTNPKDRTFKNYGGRDIQVCDRWRKFTNFFSDMGLRPEGLSIDRINNNGNYEKSNCRWATWIEQNNNKRPRKIPKVYKVRKDSKTGIAGICWRKRRQKYEVNKRVRGKRIYLGLFTNLNEAVNALKTFNEGGKAICTL